MRHFPAYLLLAAVLCSCATARYARGPQSRDIEARSGQRGIIEAVTFPSGEPGLSERRMVVYLPEDYYQDTLKRYPVLYLLHGARGNEITWADSAAVFFRLDSLRAAGKAEDFILVLPNMNRYFGDRDYRDGRAVNAVRAFWLADGEAERYFVRDVVARTDSLYRTVPRKSGRAVAGMSVGALQTLYLAASHPDTFDCVGLFSPYVYPTFAARRHEDIYGDLWPRLARQFADPPAVFSIYIGRTDFFYPHILLFECRLTRKGYPHKFVVAEGGHEWYNWTDFFVDFCQDIFR